MVHGRLELHLQWQTNRRVTVRISPSTVSLSYRNAEQ